jgi:hypothetical protein
LFIGFDFQVALPLFACAPRRVANVVIESNMFCTRRPVLELLQVRLEKLDDIIPDLAASVDVKRQLIATLPVVERMQVAVRKQA